MKTMTRKGNKQREGLSACPSKRRTSEPRFKHEGSCYSIDLKQMKSQIVQPLRIEKVWFIYPSINLFSSYQINEIKLLPARRVNIPPFDSLKIKINSLNITTLPNVNDIDLRTWYL